MPKNCKGERLQVTCKIYSQRIIKLDFKDNGNFSSLYRPQSSFVCVFLQFRSFQHSQKYLWDIYCNHKQTILALMVRWFWKENHVFCACINMFLHLRGDFSLLKNEADKIMQWFFSVHYLLRYKSSACIINIHKGIKLR